MVMDLLHGFVGVHGKRGAPGRMPIPHCLKGAPDAAGKTDVVDRVFRRELAQEPDALLIIGGRMKWLGRAGLSPQDLGEQCTLCICGQIGHWQGGRRHATAL
jgi:hypothetical protein